MRLQGEADRPHLVSRRRVVGPAHARTHRLVVLDAGEVQGGAGSAAAQHAATFAEFVKLSAKPNEALLFEEGEEITRVCHATI